MDAQTTTLPRQMNKMLDPTAPANRIVVRFVGMQRVHELTGFATSTIYSWQKVGLIPAKWRYDEISGRTESYQRFLLRVAAENSIDLGPADFIEGPAGVEA